MESDSFSDQIFRAGCPYQDTTSILQNNENDQTWKNLSKGFDALMRWFVRCFDIDCRIKRDGTSSLKVKTANYDWTEEEMEVIFFLQVIKEETRFHKNSAECA